uniref:Uncharacterized protein n=1 Tax=Ailuropoda melanoleuca TaxID=9646 RepID=A0A7N5JQA0_AILME
LPITGLRIQAPLQDWGEETEDGAVYSVSLRRQLSQRLSPGAGPGGSQVRQGGRGGVERGGRRLGEGGAEWRGLEEKRRGQSRGAELRPE